MRMVIDKICKMTVKGVKSKSESFFSLARGVLELWRKTLGGDSAPPGLDRVKATSHSTIFDIPMRPLREDQRHRPLQKVRNSRDGNYSFHSILPVARCPRIVIVK